jgi:two-component system, NarL family, response regulator LiaR
MNPIRVFVADDHTMFRRGVAAVIAAETEFSCVGEAHNGVEAVHTAPALAPDLLLLDSDMPGMGGVAAIEVLRPLLPRAHFIVMACSWEPDDVRRALAAGATSFLPKIASSQELVTVMHAAHRGHRLLSPEVNHALAASEHAVPVGADLTKRERSLLSLMAQGLANREISSRMAIAMPTVKFHVTNILSKLHAENRTEAVLAALRHKIVGLN